jgi:hypothetical protein
VIPSNAFIVISPRARRRRAAAAPPPRAAAAPPSRAAPRGHVRVVRTRDDVRGAM